MGVRGGWGWGGGRVGDARGWEGGGSVIYVGLVMWGRGEAVGVDGNIPPTGMRFLRQVAGTFVKRLDSPRLIR